MKRVLVAGGAGFVGSHLIDRLIADDAAVSCFDNFQSGRRQNIAHRLGNPHFELREHDVVEPLSIPVEAIDHLRAPPRRSASKPIPSKH